MKLVWFGELTIFAGLIVDSSTVGNSILYYQSYEDQPGQHSEDDVEGAQHKCDHRQLRCWGILT